MSRPLFRAAVWGAREVAARRVSFVPIVRVFAFRVFPNVRVVILRIEWKMFCIIFEFWWVGLTVYMG